MTNKKVLITGGTDGIGRASALILTENGYDVVIIGRNVDKLNDLLSDHKKTNCIGRLEGLICDLSNEKDLKKMLREYLKKNNCPDVLINNAGLPYNSILANEKISLDYLIRTNLWSYMWLSARIGQIMIDNQINGDIINIGSMSASVREEDSSAYVATKSGIQGFSESFRKEVNKYNIRITLIQPGAVGTNMQPITPKEEEEKQKKLEMLKAEDIAKVILFALQQPLRTNICEISVKPLRQII